MDYHFIVIIISSIFIIAGIIGMFLPSIPSIPLVFLGILIYAISTGFSTISITSIIFLLLLTILSIIFSYLLTIYGSKYFGATRYGIIGGVIGVVIGLLFSPFGLISILICPPLGTIIGEIIGGNHYRKSIKSGLGTLIGIFAGLACDMFIISIMLYIFLRALF